MNNKRIIRVLFALLLAANLSAQQSIEVISWNLESGDSNIDSFGLAISELQNIDFWGLSEVGGENELTTFKQYAEMEAVANYESILGSTGGADKLAIVYNADRFEAINRTELHHINVGGNVRAPLVVMFQERLSGFQFYFMVNHLYRSRADRRQQQSRLLNDWASQQTLPIIAVGDYNYDWEVINGDCDHDEGYDLIVKDGHFTWIRPNELVRTQCSASNGGCRYNSILDFVFVANIDVDTTTSSTILTEVIEFPDNQFTPDHRPVQATINLPVGLIGETEQLRAAILARISSMQIELNELQDLVNRICVIDPLPEQ